MSLKLYYDLISQPSRALYIFLKVCNVPFEKKLINVAKMEHLTPEYKNIHPFQKVPAIEHNGFNVMESIAIVRYVCREFNIDNHWYPKDSKSQTKIDEYLEWQHHNTRLSCALYFRTKYLEPLLSGQPAIPERVRKTEKLMKECLDALENEWLKDKPFLVGSEITVADIFGICEVQQVYVCGYDPAEGRPRLSTWMKNVQDKTSPYYQEAHTPLNKLIKKVKEGMSTSKL